VASRSNVLIMVGYALGELVKQGKVVTDSRVDLVKSAIGVAVNQARRSRIFSRRKPSSARCRRQNVAYSDSASGVYVRPKCSQSSVSRTR